MVYGDYDAYDQVNGTSYGAADTTAVRSPRSRAAVTGSAPAPVASPPQQVSSPSASSYERALDRGSRLSLKVAGALLAVLAVLFVASLVYTSVVGAVSKAGSSVAASTSATSTSSDNKVGTTSGQDASNAVSDAIDTVKGYVSSAQGVVDAAQRVSSELETLADAAASALSDLSGALSR